MSLYDKVVLKGYKDEPYGIKETLNDSLEFLYKTYGIRLLFIAVLFAVVGELINISYLGYDIWLHGLTENDLPDKSIVDQLLSFIPTILSTMFLVDFFKRLRGESIKFSSIVSDGFKGVFRLIGSSFVFLAAGLFLSLPFTFLFMLMPFTSLLLFPLLFIYIIMANAINYSLVDEVGIPFGFSLRRGYKTVIKNGSFVLRLLFVFAINFIIVWTFENVISILNNDTALLISKIVFSIVNNFAVLNTSAFTAFSFIYYADPIWPHKYDENYGKFEVNRVSDEIIEDGIRVDDLEEENILEEGNSSGKDEY